MIMEQNNKNIKLNREKKRIAAKRLREISQYSSGKISEYEKLKKRKIIPETEYITKMNDKRNIIEFDNLSTYFFTDVGVVKAVDGISFEIPEGSTVCVVGESGCGKSVTALSVMRLVPAPSGQIVGGAIRFKYKDNAIDIAKAPMDVIREIRGKEISMIFQEPMTSMNPVFTTGSQIDEVLENHFPELNKEQIKSKTIELLDLVGISRPEGIYKAYPHELSGGMRQRAMIAMALACNPKLIIADEPTTALDVTIQAQILDLLRDLKKKINISILFITHDLGVVAEMADYVVVMYAGKIVEKGLVREVYKNPQHPYTIGLIKSRPNALTKGEKLFSIPGQVPNPINMPKHCYFKARCSKNNPLCDQYPGFIQLSNTHFVACVESEGEYHE